MGFLDIFKKKKKRITSSELREMMKGFRADVANALELADDVKKEDIIKALLLRADELNDIVLETLVGVEADIEELEGRTFWASQEMVDQDIMRLNKGKDLLTRYRDELAKTKGELSARVSSKDEEQDEPASE